MCIVDGMKENFLFCLRIHCSHNVHLWLKDEKKTFRIEVNQLNWLAYFCVQMSRWAQRMKRKITFIDIDKLSTDDNERKQLW